MPTQNCGLCSVSLFESGNNYAQFAVRVLPEDVHFICGKRKAACERYLTDQLHSTEHGPGSDQRESAVPLQEKGTEKLVEETVERVCSENSQYPGTHL